MPRARGRISRFTVMAILQAARAQRLGLSRESAYSWGLNRAIFYAAAKRGFRGGSPSSGAGSDGSGAEKAEGKAEGNRELYRLGDDEAFRDTKSAQLIFTIGDSDQTEADFERQVASRFGSSENFRAAWSEAEKIVASYDRAVLESRQHFYSEVYKPRRDELSEAWSRKYGPVPSES
jgi:hypothetical protein